MPIGSIIQRARMDTQKYIEGSFSVELTISPKDINGDPLPDVVVQGLATRHRQTFDPENGLPMVGLNAHCSFSEKTLIDLGLTTRSTNNNIIVKKWKVKWTDDIGEVQYIIEEPMPDETLGIIRCMLGEFNNG